MPEKLLKTIPEKKEDIKDIYEFIGINVEPNDNEEIITWYYLRLYFQF